MEKTNRPRELVKKIIGVQYEWESHFDNMLYLFDKHLKGYKPRNLFDIGCGNGEKTVRAAKYFALDVSKVNGLDFSQQYVAECNKYFKCDMVDLESGALPYRDNAFDLVICNQVMEHLKNYKFLLHEIIRVTGKDGYIILGIPNLAHLINRIYLLFGIQPMCIALESSHVRGFTHKAFLAMLNSIGTIKIIDSSGALMYPLPLGMAKFLARHLTGLSGYVCYLLQKK